MNRDWNRQAASRILKTHLLRAVLSELPGTDRHLVVVHARFDAALRSLVPRAQAPPAPLQVRARSLRICTNRFGIACSFQESPVQVKADSEFTWREHEIAGVVSARGRRLRV